MKIPPYPCSVIPFLSAVVFDLDGTLHDHHTSVVNALHKWVPTFGSPCSDDLIRAWFTAEDTYFPMWRDGLISYQEKRRHQLRDFLPEINVLVDTDDELDPLYPEYLAHYEASWSMFPDVESALQLVRDFGLPAAVLTNGRAEQQNAKVRALGLTDYFQCVIASEKLGVSKPNPAAFHAVCEALDVVPAETLYVGDDYILDVIGARNAGLRAVYLDRLDAGPRDETARIKSLDDLGAYLR
jgi:putative hydrolase of the HAD superfamily